MSDNALPDTPPPETEEQADVFYDDMPSADDLLDRLNAIDLNRLDLEQVSAEMLGKWKWARVLVMPVGAVLLFLLTWLFAALSGYLIPSFVVAALTLLLIGRLLDRYEKALMQAARQAVENYIAEVEGNTGLLIYFQDFLPKKYRPLIKALQDGFYGYIPQYREAVQLLREQLDPVKFQTWWLIKRDTLRTLGRPIKYYEERARRLLLLNDEDLATLLEHVSEQDILNLLLLAHDEKLARRVLGHLSVLIAQNIKTELIKVQKLDKTRAKISVDKVMDTGRKLAAGGQLSVEPDFFA
ncbi:hypothetical protein [Sulfurivirga sp.]|uniref:hypothetical protein n=1 Tax=Sulfurivirga sp. TaxID=2614236 RepID=UPI0025F484EF|nr:hypothetical protein [Sulfurivirga sp.]